MPETPKSIKLSMNVIVYCCSFLWSVDNCVIDRKHEDVYQVSAAWQRQNFEFSIFLFSD